jgi:GDP-L-fucose synthase
MKNYSDELPVNVGVGEDLTIMELASMVGEITGFSGTIELDTSKPDGTPRKLLDVRRLNELGWHAQTGLREGLQTTYAWFIRNQSELRS